MIYFVDLEASSLLPGGFPIEIGWVDQDGRGESYLIRPTEEWIDSGYGWSHQSEAVHGINLETLMREGAPPEEVARRAADVMSPRHCMVFSDAPGYDGGWLETLMHEGGEKRTVRLLDVTQAYGWACRPLLDALGMFDGLRREDAERFVRQEALGIVSDAQQAEAMRSRVRHRALPDAEGLWRTWRAIKDEVARRSQDERS